MTSHGADELVTPKDGLQPLWSLSLLVRKHPELFTYVNKDLATLGYDPNDLTDEKFPGAFATRLWGIHWTHGSKKKLLTTKFGLELHL